MPQKSNDSRDDRAAMVIKIGGEERVITFEELALSNNLTLEVLVRILVEKGVFTPDEFMQKLAQVEKEQIKKE